MGGYHINSRPIALIFFLLFVSGHAVAPISMNTVGTLIIQTIPRQAADAPSTGEYLRISDRHEMYYNSATGITTDNGVTDYSYVCVESSTPERLSQCGDCNYLNGEWQASGTYTLGRCVSVDSRDSENVKLRMDVRVVQQDGALWWVRAVVAYAKDGVTLASPQPHELEPRDCGNDAIQMCDAGVITLGPEDEVRTTAANGGADEICVWAQAIDEDPIQTPTGTQVNPDIQTWTCFPL